MRALVTSMDDLVLLRVLADDPEGLYVALDPDADVVAVREAILAHVEA